MNAADLYDGGAILLLSQAEGHKGYARAFMVDLLGGVLSGGVRRTVREIRCNQIWRRSVGASRLVSVVAVRIAGLGFSTLRAHRPGSVRHDHLQAHRHGDFGHDAR